MASLNMKQDKKRADPAPPPCLACKAKQEGRPVKRAHTCVKASKGRVVPSNTLAVKDSKSDKHRRRSAQTFIKGAKEFASVFDNAIENADDLDDDDLDADDPAQILSPKRLASSPDF